MSINNLSLYSSYASGKKPWKNGEEGYEAQSYSDGKLEIVGFQTADFMFLQLGVSGDCVAQASKIRIVTECALPMQVDGEPCLLQASEILIDKLSQSLMIAATDEPATASSPPAVITACLQTPC